MPTRFRCFCGHKIKTADETVGKKAKCPACLQWVRIPKSENYEVVAKKISRKPDKISAALAALDKIQTEHELDEAQKPENHNIPPIPGSTAADERDSAFGAKGKVLVADSVEEDLRYLAELLRDHGYFVIEARNGNEAVGLIRSRLPDAAFLDVHLDGLGGFQVAKLLRDVANTLNEKVWQMPLFITATKIRGRDKQYAMSIGSQGYFSKPVNPAQTTSRLEKEIAKYRDH